MPIYAYRCAACGHAKDVLQKMSDEPLTVCPQCGAGSFAKQLTAAGFQLKGSGWYVTDFRGGNAPAPRTDDGAEAPAQTVIKAGAEKPAEKPAQKATEKAADKVTPSAAPAAAPAPAPSPGSGS